MAVTPLPAQTQEEELPETVILYDR
jgi:hypothetical protein